MSIGTPDVLLTGNDTTAATSFTFTATTPAASRRLFAAVRTARAAPAPIAPLSFTAFGVTWTQKQTTLSGTTRLTLFEAFSGSSPLGTSVVVDVNDGSGNHSSCSIALVAHPDASGLINAVGAASSGVNLGSAGADSGVALFGITTTGASSYAPEAGFTEALDFGVGGAGAARMTYIWRNDNADFTPVATSNPSGSYISIGFEIGGSQVKDGAATLAGTGALTATGVISKDGGFVSMPGTGALAAPGELLHGGRATLAGSGAMTVAGELIKATAARVVPGSGVSPRQTAVVTNAAMKVTVTNG